MTAGETVSCTYTDHATEPPTPDVHHPGLPDTGSPVSLWFLVLGLVMVAAGGVLVVRWRF